MAWSREFLAVIFSFSLSACVVEAPPLSVDADVRSIVAEIQTAPLAAERIEADVAYLADDARAGREAGEPGYDAAARYVAARFQSLGLQPGAEKQRWFQYVTLRAATRREDASFASITTDEGVDVPLQSGADYLIGRAIVEPQFDLSAPVVFVGYGVSEPEIGYDDYADVDVDGKIVVAFSDAPKHVDSEQYAYFRSNGYKLKMAASHGAVGFVTLPSKASLTRLPWARRVATADRERLVWVHPDGKGNVAAPEILGTASLSPAGAEKLFEGEALPFSALQAAVDEQSTLQSFALEKSLTLRGASEYSEKQSANVVGVIEGSDPRLRDEVVVLSAHLDHVGVNEPRRGGEDHIHNGALDNAMGVATMLDVARAFTENQPPARTLVFLAVTAEEKGLIGADYFAHYPTIGEKSIVANVNLDMPLTLFPFTDVIAFGAERSTLGETVRVAASELDIALIPDPIPEFGIFTRSDHYRFVEQGVPSVFLFIGFGNGGETVFRDFMATHYHQPTDDLDLPIDYDSAARFAELNYRVARQVADAPARPAWIEGDFFGERFGDGR